MNFAELAKRLVGAHTTQSLVFSRISTDTRTLQAGEVFLALRGDNYDGHKFVELAIENGAVGLIVESELSQVNVPQLVVKDTTLALGNIAAIHRQRFNGKVISITGSCGKTTVKSMLQSICQNVAKTLATEGNKNNHIGVPLTLLQIDGDEQYAIIEAGTSGPGEIAYLGKIICPQVALVNNVAAAHLEGLGSVEKIAEEKAELYRSLDEGTGLAIINLDDDFFHEFIEINQKVKCIGFGFNLEKISAVANKFPCVSGETLDDFQGLRLGFAGEFIEIEMPVPGEVNRKNALAAAACALAAGLSLESIKTGIEGFASVAGRMQRLPTAAARLLIDDSYNANPASVKAAIDFLASQKDSLFIFGDMGELGSSVEEAHAEIGRYAAQKNIEALLAVGANSQLTVKAFGEQGEWFQSQSELVEVLQHRDLRSKSILVKGSRGSKMENVVRAILTFGDKHAGLAS